MYIFTAHTFVYDAIWRSLKPQISSSSELQSGLLQNYLNVCCICWKANDFHIIVVYHHCLYLCGPLKKQTTRGYPEEVAQLSAFTALAKKLWIHSRLKKKNTAKANDSLALRLAPISSLGLWHQKPSWNASIRWILCIYNRQYIYSCNINKPSWRSRTELQALRFASQD